ncbi:hypothetical protein DRP05_02565 [Archaeoglobales archaeon]|nr:MAG: hypothetical protein DRP05_02565 [Archaeoglobales archaeon]
MKEVLSEAIEKWGVNANLWVFMEEIGELTKEISKAIRYKPNYDRISEEVADVEIAIELVKIIFNLDQKRIEEIKRHKIERLMKRLEGLE